MLERFQTLVGLAAQSAATQLNLLSHSVDPFPEAQPRSAEPSLASLPLALGGIVASKVEVMARHEVAFGVVPDMARRLQAIANRTPLTVLTAGEALSAWDAVSVGRDELWVDIGSGNSDSLGRLARRHGSRFIGIDVENSAELEFEFAAGSPNLTRLPDNARYLVLSHNRPGRGGLVGHPRLEQVSMVGRWEESTSSAQRLSAATVDTIGAGTASVVSFVFPYLHEKPRSLAHRVFTGPMPRREEHQLRTAVRLLRPGGLGVMLLEAGWQAEQYHLVPNVLAALRSLPEVASIRIAGEPVAVNRLDIAPYAPHHGDRPAYIETFPTARPVFFRRKG